MTRGFDVLRRTLLVVIALSASCFAGQVASAPAKVHVDPNGPAGQQYALPLDSARGQASGTPDAGVPGATTKAPLFGQGIKPARSQPGTGQGARAKSQGSAKTAGNDDSVAISGRKAITTGASSSPTTRVAALIAAVVLLGGVGALVGGRRRPAEPPA